MDSINYELVATVLLAAAGLLWILSICLWVGLRIPEEISEAWKVMRD